MCDRCRYYYTTILLYYYTSIPIILLYYYTCYYVAHKHHEPNGGGGSVELNLTSIFVYVWWRIYMQWEEWGGDMMSISGTKETET